NCESQLASIRQNIAGQQATIDHERSRSAELEEEAGLHGRNLLAMSDKAGDVRSRLKATDEELAAAEAAKRAAAQERAERDRCLMEVATKYDAARKQAESGRQQHLTALQRATSLANQVEASQARFSAVQQAIANHERQYAELLAVETALAESLATAQQRQTAV